MRQWLTDARGKVTVDGYVLEYQCCGPPPDNNLTLVLLHEGLGCIELWRDVPERLVALTGCGVFVYSRAGYGGSDSVVLPRATDFMYHEATTVLPQLLLLMGIDRCVLIGHSDGATIAAIHTGTQEDFKTRGLILIAPHFFAEEISISAITEARVAYETGALRSRLARYHNDVDCAFYGWSDVWLSDLFKTWNVSEVIDYFRVPVLGIQGRQDQYGTLSQLNEVESRCHSPFEMLIVDNCKHSPHLEQPDLTLNTIAEFITRLIAMESSG